MVIGALLDSIAAPARETPLKTFTYRPDFAASVKRSCVVDTSLGLVLVGSLGSAFIWAAFRNLNDHVGVGAIGITVAMVTLVVRESRRIFNSLSAQAVTLLTLDGSRLDQREAASGRILGTIDLAADFEHASRPLLGRRQYMTVRQCDQIVEFNSEIEGRRELVVAILARKHGIATDSTEDDEASPPTLRFSYLPEAMERLARSFRRVRIGCSFGGVLFFGLLAYAFFRDGRPTLASVLLATGVAVIQLIVWATHRAHEAHRQRANYITFTSPNRLCSHDQTDALLGAIDVDRRYEFKYRNTQFRITQDDQTVEFETDLAGAMDLVTWVLDREFHDPSG